MGKRRRGPSSPAEILARNALQRGRQARAERTQARDPAAWGIVAEIRQLETSAGVEVQLDPSRREKILSARRSDGFDALFRAGGLSSAQHQAASRYMKDWMKRAGYREGGDSTPGMTPIDSEGHAEGITIAMIGAGVRIARAHNGIGPADAKLLQEMVEPLAMHGVVVEWRIVVSRVTDERDKTAQATRVRSACENLRLAYEAIDKEPRDLRFDTHEAG